MDLAGGSATSRPLCILPLPRRLRRRSAFVLVLVLAYAGEKYSAWPGIRSSLLAALDVYPRVALRILRHSKIAATMEIYTEVSSAATREALEKLGQWLDSDS